MTSYYFWKWADNDLPGKPADVFRSLVRGEMHPALQAFDSRPLLSELESAAAKGRASGEEWAWEIHPAHSPQAAIFVFVTCPGFFRSGAAAREFVRWACPLDLSGYDEEQGLVTPGLLPKLTCFFHGQFPSERFYDISEEDLPVLLRRIRPREKYPFAVLENRRGHFVECHAHGRRFVVKWKEVTDLNDASKFHFWKAQDRDRLSKLEEPNDPNLEPEKDPDLLRYADTLRIFRDFFRGKPRPAHYHWLNINDQIQ